MNKKKVLLIGDNGVHKWYKRHLSSYNEIVVLSACTFADAEALLSKDLNEIGLVIITDQFIDFTETTRIAEIAMNLSSSRFQVFMDTGDNELDHGVHQSGDCHGVVGHLSVITFIKEKLGVKI